MLSLHATTLTTTLLLVLIWAAVLIFGQKDPRPTSIGESGGKEYFVADATTGSNNGFTWNKAKRYCKRFGLDLASIESTTTLVFLSGRLSLAEDYWIDGRDSHMARQMSWDKNEAPISDELPVNFSQLKNYRTCASYDAKLRQLVMLPCSRQIVEGGALCEQWAFKSKRK